MGVYVIDEIMGRGKTTAMINYINSSDRDKKYLFIVPLSSEEERVRTQCPDFHFFSPQELPRKRDDIKRLFSMGVNIVSTHSLFSLMDDEAVRLASENGYTLVMDEVASVITETELTTHDIALLQRCVDYEDNGLVIWTDDDYEGKFSELKASVQDREVYRYNDRYWISLMSIEKFTAFRDVFIMTYLFEHQMQRCFFDLYGIEYERLYVIGDSVDTYRLSETPSEPTPCNYKSLIHIVDAKINDVGHGEYSLSKSWYQKRTTPESLAALRNNTENFFRHYAEVGGEKASASERLWTVYKGDGTVDWKELVAGHGYSRGCFLPCNSKGTNKYRKRKALAYLINLFPNTGIYNFLRQCGVELDRNGYALSEMIQWIWRSAIRDGEEVVVYIPSRRMRNILIDWLDSLNDGGG